MRLILDYADKTNQVVTLTPSSDFGGNTARLVKFYTGMGFVANKGKNRDFSTSDSMYRLPKSKMAEEVEQPATQEPKRKSLAKDHGEVFSIGDSVLDVDFKARYFAASLIPSDVVSSVDGIDRKWTFK